MKEIKKTKERGKMGKKSRYTSVNLLIERSFGLILCIFLVISSEMLLSNAAAKEAPITRIFTDPLVVQTTELGQNFTVNINISDVVDLYAWQTGITFNPKILECTGFYEGDFLRNGSTARTIFCEHVKGINNTLGVVYYRGCCPLGPVPGVNGSGQLAYVTFKAVGIGVSDLHLTDIILLNSKLEDIEFEVVESFNIFLLGTNTTVGLVNNLTGSKNAENPPASGVFDTNFSADDKKISLDIISQKSWFCQVNVPKSLLTCSTPSEWTIKADGVPLSYTVNENATHTLLYFEHDKGNHMIEIIGTEIPSGPPSNSAPSPILVIVTTLLGLFTLTAALLDFKKTRRTFGYKMATPSTNSFI
jgi:hypothetical protein